MADCPYARCIQERKHIKRELLRWAKNMVFVVGLERVAEELMGRRRWKQYQDTLYTGGGTRSNHNNNNNNNNGSIGSEITTTTAAAATAAVTAAATTQQSLHHRLYPGLSSASSSSSSLACNQNQITGQHLLLPVPATTTTTTTTTPGTTIPITVKQENLQRHHLANHNLHHHLNRQEQLKENIKVEAIEDTGESSPKDPTSNLYLTNIIGATSTTTCLTTTTPTTQVTTAPKRRRRKGSGEEEDGEFVEEGVEGREESEVEDQEDGLRQKNGAEEQQEGDSQRNQEEPNNRIDRLSVSPHRTENDRDHLVADDTEGTKERTEEDTLERAPVTQGLLRVKKEEELQDVSVCGIGGSSALTIGAPNTTTIIGAAEAMTRSGNNATVAAAVIGGPFLLAHRHMSPPLEDWKPSDKCYFCQDGKLPHDDQRAFSPQSDCSSSSRSAESPMSVPVDPAAASVVAAALSGAYPTLLPQWCLPPREAAPLGVGVQAHHDTILPAVDQPLDLSAKPKTSQDNSMSLLEHQKIPLRMPTGIDPKTLFNSCYRAKPRMTGPVAAAAAVGGGPVVGAGGGRRTYTEEELQAALRDIQSGKLGTRRAAVIYGIPRSTLRNKVYKLAIEREKDASLSSAHSHPPQHHESSTGVVSGTQAITTTTTTTSVTNISTSTPNTNQNAPTVTSPSQNDEVEDKELSGAEEEKEVEKALLKPLLSLEDLVRFSALEGGGGDSLRALLQRGQETGSEWPGLEHANIGPYIQKMLAAAAPFKGMESHDYRIPEVMRRLMNEDKRLNKSVNGDQSHHQALQHHLQSLQSSQQRVSMLNDDFNSIIEEDASDSGQGRAILKIPSYKPANTPGCSSKNGESTSTGFVQGFPGATATPSPGLLERASPAFSGTSSPTNSLVGKAVAVNFRDVIAKSISVKFQEGQASGTGAIPSGCQSQQNQANMLTEPSPFKRGRYTPPQTSSQQQAQHQTKTQQNQDANKSKPGGGGKGTRPKRGKYRNYDRDSLVEAVRAVQRGEMSVHRAGSYYGVPHSTLEYKVKERHLMRPRKRDQKQPDEKSKETATAPGSAAGSVIRLSNATDKKPQMKSQKPFTPPSGIPSPNGLKIPPFMEGMPHLPFGPFNFWNPTAFMPSPFMSGAPNVPILPDQYFSAQRMRGLQEQQRTAMVQHQQRDGSVAIPSTTSDTTAGSSNSRNSSMAKTTRDMVESFYDGTSTNGSFLDNLIRSSLESGIPRGDQQAVRSQQQTSSETMSSKALIDQLCRNSRRTPLPRVAQDSSEDESYRGPASRMMPDRPERVPTVDLSPSPSDRRTDDGSDGRLTSPPTPLSISRAGSRDEDSTRDSRLDRNSREREIHHNGSQDERKSSIQNHYPDIHNLYEKKSACDSKLIVDQKTQQQQQPEFNAVGGGLVVQLQRGYNSSGSNRSSNETNSSNQQQSSASANEQQRGINMEDPVEQ